MQAPKRAPGPGLTADKKRLIFVAVFVVLVVAGLLIVPGFFRTVKEEPFVASARVAAQQGVLHADANPASKSVASVSRSTLVHVLGLPKSLTTGYVQIQARDGDSYTRAGYIQAVDLIEWESKDPKVALSLARLSGPMEAGTDAEMRAQIDRLNSVAATFNGKPEAGAASLDAAKLEFALARKMKDTNPTGPEWQTSLADLSTRLELLRSDATVQGAVDDLLKQIRDLMGTAPNQPPSVTPGATPGTTPAVNPPANGQPPAPTGPATPDDIKKWMQTAEYLRKSYDYKNALYFVQKVLKADPANADAKKLQDKIKAAIDLENSAK